jgi:hypothetical protein
VNTGIVSEERWNVAVPEESRPLETGTDNHTDERQGTRSRLTARGLLEDLVLVLLLVVLCPLVILAIGTPVALFARLLIEIAERL